MWVGGADKINRPCKELAFSRGVISRVFVQGAPENAFCRMERGEIPLSEVSCMQCIAIGHCSRVCLSVLYTI